jgi:hypothetical protein
MMNSTDVSHRFDVMVSGEVATVERAEFFLESEVALVDDKAVDTFGTLGSAGTFGGCFGCLGTAGCCC